MKWNYHYLGLFLLLFILLTPSNSLSLILISLSNTHMNRQNWTLEHMRPLYHSMLNSELSVSTDTTRHDWPELLTRRSNAPLSGAPQKDSEIRHSQSTRLPLHFFVNQFVLYYVPKSHAVNI